MNEVPLYLLGSCIIVHPSCEVSAPSCSLFVAYDKFLHFEPSLDPQFTV